MTPAEHISRALCLIEHVKHLEAHASYVINAALRDILKTLGLQAEAVAITLPVLPLAIVTKARAEIVEALDAIVPMASADDFLASVDVDLQDKQESLTRSILQLNCAFEALSAVASGRAAN